MRSNRAMIQTGLSKESGDTYEKTGRKIGYFGTKIYCSHPISLPMIAVLNMIFRAYVRTCVHYRYHMNIPLVYTCAHSQIHPRNRQWDSVHARLTKMKFLAHTQIMDSYRSQCINSDSRYTIYHAIFMGNKT